MARGAHRQHLWAGYRWAEMAVAAFLVCAGLQHCCNHIVMSFVMGPLGAAVQNTPFFARSKVGYPETKQKDALYLCRNRKALCTIRILNRARAQNRREDV